MKTTCRLLGILFLIVPLLAASMSLGRFANTCQSVYDYNYLQGKWVANCQGGCNGAACNVVQAGNPIANFVPLACSCFGVSGLPVYSECAAMIYLDSNTGEFVTNPAPGCINPGASCNMSWTCQTVQQPTPPDEGPFTWRPCECKP